MKKIIVFLILLFAVSAYSGTLLQTSQSIIAKKKGSVGKATITYDSQVSNSETSQATCEISINPTDSLSNKVLIIGIGWDASAQRTVSSVTYDYGSDNHACTEIDNQAYETVTYNGVALYYLLDTSIDDAATTLRVTMSDSVENLSCGAIVLYNVKQQANEADNKATGTSDAPSVSVTSVTANAWIVDIVGNHIAANNATVDSGQTERWFEATGGHVDCSTIANITPDAQAMTYALDESANWGIIGAAWEPADL